MHQVIHLKWVHFFKNYIYLFIFGCAGSLYGLYGLSLVAVSRGYSLLAEHRLPIVVAPLAEHGL